MTEGWDGYRTGSVTSADGTTIGFRQIGQGPAVLLVHGGMQAAQSFSRLGAALSDAFTVTVPDRRGRGSSGPAGQDSGLGSECQDLAALVAATGASRVFGLSSGAIIALHAALAVPSITRVALYEPPLSINGSTPMEWVDRFELELAVGDLAAAMVTAMQGTRSDPAELRHLPRTQIETFFAEVMEGESVDPPEGSHPVPLRELVPSMRGDIHLVKETEDSLEALRVLDIEVLLLGGSLSAPFLSSTLTALESVLPRSTRVEFAGLDHVAADDRGDPERVALELRRFFEAGPD